MISRTIYFVAGETSADNHGEALMRTLHELDPALRFLGRGGPRMATVANDQFHNWIGDAAVVGLWEVIKNYGYFRRAFRQTLDEIDQTKPEAVVLIDYPGFNLRLARALGGRKTKPRIIYYVSPQVWAWHRARIKQMARSIDLMLCIFPFEVDLYNQSGLRTRFVGHPMIDRLTREKIAAVRDPNLIALFPGSRKREVRKIFPVLIAVIQRLRKRRPELRFEVAAASVELAGMIRSMLSEQPELSNVEIKTNESAAVMQRAAAGVVASGSATLEAAYFRLPFVLVYKVAWLTYFAARLVVRVQHIGMPNLLAGKEIVPEFIQHGAAPDAIAAAVLGLIENKRKAADMVQEFDAVVKQLDEGGASQRAAREIILELDATG